MLEVAIITILVFAVGLIIYSYIQARKYNKVLIQNTSTRGMNGLEGSVVNLVCPVGQVISFKSGNLTSTRGALICSGDTTGKCDAFFQYGVGQKKNFFNPDTTIDVFSPDSKFTDIKSCEGKQTCSWTVPKKGDRRFPSLLKITPTNPKAKQIGPGPGCVGVCTGQIGFIGTYDCVAPPST